MTISSNHVTEAKKNLQIAFTSSLDLRFLHDLVLGNSNPCSVVLGNSLDIKSQGGYSNLPGRAASLPLGLGG
jgi:hypothetical protein